MPLVVIYYPAFMTGHLAIALTGLGEENFYISFYPPNATSRFYFRLHDLKSDGKDITKIAILPSEESCGYGPSEKAIYDWWKNEFKPNDIAYGLFNNRNCSSIVYRALRVGQLRSSSLLYSSPVKKNWWIDSPDNVFNYACALGSKLLENLVTELQQSCELSKFDYPYAQAVALYVKIRKFNNSEYNLTLIKPFCDAVKHTLETFHEALQKNSNTDTDSALLNMSETGDLTGVDIDVYFKRLQNLADYIYKCPENERQEAVADLLQNSIKNVLMLKMSTHINSTSLHTVMDKESIGRALEIIEKMINDEKNPHKEFFQPGSKVSLRPFSSARI